MKTLVDKKKVIQSRGGKSAKVSTTYITLREGFQQFEHDLSKLQQFVEINATAFSKILKKVIFFLHLDGLDTDCLVGQILKGTAIDDDYFFF